MENNIKTNEMEGKVAIVTGAASGIGRAIATLLFQRGCKVLAEDYNEEVTEMANEFEGIFVMF